MFGHLPKQIVTARNSMLKPRNDSWCARVPSNMNFRVWCTLDNECMECIECACEKLVCTDVFFFAFPVLVLSLWKCVTGKLSARRDFIGSRMVGVSSRLFVRKYIYVSCNRAARCTTNQPCAPHWTLYIFKQTPTASFKARESSLIELFARCVWSLFDALSCVISSCTLDHILCWEVF